MFFGKPATAAKPRAPVNVAKSAARVANRAAKATANAKTPAAAVAANRTANKAAAVAKAAANKAAENARAAAAAKKAANSQAAANKAAANARAAAAAKKAANQAAKSANESNTTMVRLGRGFKNMTNKVMSLATQATALGGSAYAAYVETNNAQALAVAAVCMVLVYMAYGFLGRKPNTKVSVLQAQINTENRKLTRRITTHSRYPIYKEYMKMGNVTAANDVMVSIRGNFASNIERIASMKTKLDKLLSEVIDALPLTPPEISSFKEVMKQAVIFAKAALGEYKEIQTLQLNRVKAETAHTDAMTDALVAQTRANAARHEKQVQAVVAPLTARVRGAAEAFTNVTTTATTAATAFAPLGRVLLSGAQGVSRAYHRRRGVRPQ